MTLWIIQIFRIFLIKSILYSHLGTQRMRSTLATHHCNLPSTCWWIEGKIAPHSSLTWDLFHFDEVLRMFVRALKVPLIVQHTTKADSLCYMSMKVYSMVCGVLINYRKSAFLSRGNERALKEEGENFFLYRRIQICSQFSTNDTLNPINSQLNGDCWP